MRSSSGHVCNRCTRLLLRVPLNVLPTSSVALRSRQIFTQSRRREEPAISIPVLKKASSKPHFWGSDVTISSADNAALVGKAQTIGESITSSPSPPSEEEVLGALQILKYAALQLNSPSSQKVNKQVDGLLHAVSTGPGSASQSQKNSAKTAATINLLSSLAYKIMKHPPVFLTPKLLETYIAVQLALQRPSTFPEIFDLYTNKPVPVQDSSPVRYTNPSPNKPAQAIPQLLADEALDAALKNKNLTLALDIIDSTYGQTSFQRNKFMRKGLPIVTGLVLTPLAAIPLAQAWAEQSLVADPTWLATYVWLGMLTYVSSVSGLGYVALTTYNDQMQRVTWMPGSFLRDRWFREEERAAADKVALAWGFKEVSRRGQEEGKDWDLLREWCGQRGMLLDASELMDGME